MLPVVSPDESVLFSRKSGLEREKPKGWFQLSHCASESSSWACLGFISSPSALQSYAMKIGCKHFSFTKKLLSVKGYNPGSFLLCLPEDRRRESLPLTSSPGTQRGPFHFWKNRFPSCSATPNTWADAVCPVKLYKASIFCMGRGSWGTDNIAEACLLGRLN